MKPCNQIMHKHSCNYQPHYNLYQLPLVLYMLAYSFFVSLSKHVAICVHYFLLEEIMTHTDTQRLYRIAEQATNANSRELVR